MIALARPKTKSVTEAIANAKRAKHGSLHFVSFDLGKIDEILGLVKGLRKEFGPCSASSTMLRSSHDGALALMHNSQVQIAHRRH